MLCTAVSLVVLSNTSAVSSSCHTWLDDAQIRDRWRNPPCRTNRYREIKNPAAHSCSIEFLLDWSGSVGSSENFCVKPSIKSKQNISTRQITEEGLFRKKCYSVRPQNTTHVKPEEVLPQSSSGFPSIKPLQTTKKSCCVNKASIKKNLSPQIFCHTTTNNDSSVQHSNVPFHDVFQAIRPLNASEQQESRVPRR